MRNCIGDERIVAASGFEVLNAVVRIPTTSKFLRLLLHLEKDEIRDYLPVG